MPYVYCAELFCDDCGEKACELITARGQAPAEPENQSTYDSDDFPKYVESGSTDCPSHCPDCGKYLAEPLTPAGIDYVIDYLRMAIETDRATQCEHAWADDLADSYFLTGDDKHVLDSFRSKFSKKGAQCSA